MLQFVVAGSSKLIIAAVYCTRVTHNVPRALGGAGFSLRGLVLARSNPRRLKPAPQMRRIPERLFFWQGKDVQRVATVRVTHVGKDCARDVARAAAAQACGDGDVLFAGDAEGYGEALHRGAEARLPQRFSGAGVDGAEDAVDVSDESDAAGGGENGGEE